MQGPTANGRRIRLLRDDGPLLYIKDITSAKEAWEKLRDMYNPRGVTTEYLTLREFYNTTLEQFSSMEEYVFKAKAFVDDLKGKETQLTKAGGDFLGAK